MTARTLADWLDYQQRIHPRAIELGLDRVREVWQRLGAPRPAPLVVTVGGTNGKGSTVAFLEAMLRAAGRRVGAYTSPHLRRYNERVRVCGAEVGDAALIDAFTRIEAARGAVPLTYFEFGTLAALWIFAQSGLDAAVLEVGLGGRLDAVNLIDADAAIVTTVDLDHQDWLGNDRDSIGREKAGIFRPGRPAVIGTRTPPAGLIAEAERIGARLLRAGRDFHITPMVDAWCWRCGAEALTLPEPMLAAPCQIDNVAAAIAAWHALRERLGWEPRALADKDVGGIVAPLAAHVARWYGGGLDAETPRGLPAPELRTRMLAAAPLAVESHEHIRAALAAAAAAAGSADRILAFGSFFVASAALDWAEARAYRESPERAGYNSRRVRT